MTTELLQNKIEMQKTEDQQSRKIKKLKSFSDAELETSLKSLVKREHELLSDIILHIKEVELRKLYLKKNFGSLFLYLTQYMGYANGPAQRRIDAARLSVEVPELIENIKSGELNLSQVSLVQQSIRQKQAEMTKQNMKSGNRAMVKIKAEAKIQIIENLKNKSITESEKMVSKALELEIKSKPKVIQQSDESVRLEVTFTKEQWEKLERMRSLISHSVPDGSWDQVFEHVADKLIASKTKTRKAAVANVHKAVEAKDQKTETTNAANAANAAKAEIKCSGSTEEIPSKKSYYQLRKVLLSRNASCQHIDKTTNRKCTSTWKLQSDHINPKWAGGKDTPENLQVLCAQHNRWRYRVQVGL